MFCKSDQKDKCGISLIDYNKLSWYILKMFYKVWGKVRKGKSRGRLLGFPTANINLKKNIPDGIYVSSVKFNKKFYKAATFIGNSKTYNENDKRVEAFILNFNKDIYGRWISITLFKKIRNNKKFKTEKDLIFQIKNDLKTIEKLNIEDFIK